MVHCPAAAVASSRSRYSSLKSFFSPVSGSVVSTRLPASSMARRMPLTMVSVCPRALPDLGRLETMRIRPGVPATSRAPPRRPTAAKPTTSNNGRVIRMRDVADGKPGCRGPSTGVLDGIQYDRDGAVVHQLHLHVGPEPPLGDRHPERPQAVGERPAQRLGLL